MMYKCAVKSFTSFIRVCHKPLKMYFLLLLSFIRLSNTNECKPVRWMEKETWQLFDAAKDVVFWGWGYVCNSFIIIRVIFFLAN